MPSFDKRGIARNFSASSESYLSAAVVQREAATHLGQLVAEREPTEIVDLGCGPGLLTRQLALDFPGASVLGIDMAEGMIEQGKAFCRQMTNASFDVGDMEEFLQPGRFDLATCNYSLQWVASAERLLANVHDSLCEGGRWAFAVPLAGSFHELYSAYESATGRRLTGVKLRTSSEYQQLLAGAGFDVLTIICFDRPVRFRTVPQALHSFRVTGASFRHHDTYQPLPVPTMRRLLAAYAAKATDPDGTVCLTHRYGCFLAERG